MKSIAIENFYPHNNKRLKVEWNLSKRCNFDCSYCSSDIHDDFSSWRRIGDYKKAIDKLLASTDKKIWISFTGGEPCVYPKFLDLIKYCKENGIEFVSVCSNGSRRPEYYIDLMNYLDNIIISYHFEYKVNALDTILAINKHVNKLKKTMHAHIMMLPGHFEEAMKVMDILKQNNVPFGVRRIRPLCTPDGHLVRPYQTGGSLRQTSSGPDYSDDGGYYSDEELNFFKGKIHEYT